MNYQWIAGLLIAFGIFVAVFGVIAYLRMIKASRRGETVELLTPADSDRPFNGSGQPSPTRQGESSD